MSDGSAGIGDLNKRGSVSVANYTVSLEDAWGCGEAAAWFGPLVELIFRLEELVADLFHGILSAHILLAWAVIHY